MFCIKRRIANCRAARRSIFRRPRTWLIRWVIRFENSAKQIGIFTPCRCPNVPPPPSSLYRRRRHDVYHSRRRDVPPPPSRCGQPPPSSCTPAPVHSFCWLTISQQQNGFMTQTIVATYRQIGVSYDKQIFSPRKTTRGQYTPRVN